MRKIIFTLNQNSILKEITGKLGLCNSELHFCLHATSRPRHFLTLNYDSNGHNRMKILVLSTVSVACASVRQRVKIINTPLYQAILRLVSNTRLIYINADPSYNYQVNLANREQGKSSNLKVCTSLIHRLIFSP